MPNSPQNSASKLCVGKINPNRNSILEEFLSGESTQEPIFITMREVMIAQKDASRDTIVLNGVPEWIDSAKKLRIKSALSI